MGKYDKNGVRHKGWADVAEANSNRRGRSGRADKEYEKKARDQGVDLSRTHYRKTADYRYGRL